MPEESPARPTSPPGRGMSPRADRYPKGFVLDDSREATDEGREE
jgi:hypothetical protein